MTHHIVVTYDHVRLVHPESCQRLAECAEGRYERAYGLTPWEQKDPGAYPVEWWGGFYGDEYDEGLAPVVDEPRDLHAVLDADPTPDSGSLRGFPYRGGRWSA